MQYLRTSIIAIFFIICFVAFMVKWCRCPVKRDASKFKCSWNTPFLFLLFLQQVSWMKGFSF
jgi:succinate dehydrogenase hydrophobic anchor subunit